MVHRVRCPQRVHAVRGAMEEVVGEVMRDHAGDPPSGRRDLDRHEGPSTAHPDIQAQEPDADERVHDLIERSAAEPADQIAEAIASAGPATHQCCLERGQDEKDGDRENERIHRHTPPRGIGPVDRLSERVSVSTTDGRANAALFPRRAA